MPDQNITIKFRATGNEALEQAIKRLDIASKRLQGKTSLYEKELRKLNKTGATTVRNHRLIHNETNKMGGAFSVLRSKLLLASFAAGIFAKTIGKMAKLYGEQEAAEKRLENAIGRVSTALLTQASAFQKVTAFGDEEIINAMALAGAYTDNERAIKKLSEAALDLSTAKGMDLNTTMDLLTKSVFSSTNAMSRYGIDMEGVIGSTARLESATDAVAKLYGGRAKKDAETFLGATKQLGNALGDVGENIGSVFIPVLLFSARAMKSFAETFDENRVKSYATAIGGAAVAYSIYAVATGKAAKAMVLFNKISKKNLVILGGMIIIGEMIERMALFGDETADLEAELDKLNGTIGSLNFELKAGFDLLTQIALAEQQLHNITDKKNALDSEALMIFVERNRVLEKAKKGLIDEHELKLAILQIDIKSGLLNEKITKQKIANTQKTAKSFGQIGSAITELSKGNKSNAIMGLHISYAAALADSIAGAAKSFQQGGIPGYAAGISMMFSMFTRLNTINAQIRKIESMEQGGLVGGRRHSQGGTMIEAESGEFVMSRSAVESVGIETMNRINQGGGAVNVSFTGNVLSQDFIESEAIPAIKEAIRRGADIGIA